VCVCVCVYIYIYIYIYIYRDSITDHVQINSIYQEASCRTFSVFKGDYYALSFLFLYEGTYIRGWIQFVSCYVWEFDVISDLRFDSAYTMLSAMCRECCTKVRNLDDDRCKKYISPRTTPVRHDDDNDNDDDDDILMFILSY